MSQYDKLVGATIDGVLPPVVLSQIAPRITRNGLPAVEKGELVLSARDHGAAGDGQTDDTAAIQAAINTAGPGGTVYLPTGTYVVGPLTVPERATLTGTGQSRLKVRDGQNDHVVHLAGIASSVSNLEIDGNSTGQAPAGSGRHGQAIILATGEGCRVSDLHIEDAANRSVVVNPTARHTVVERVVLARCGTDGDRTGFDVKGSYSTFSACHVYDHGNGHAFRIANTMDEPTEFTIVQGCVVERSEHNAYTLEIGSRYVVFANCVARDVPQAVKGDGSAHHITVIGCIFERITLPTAFNMGTVAYTVVSGTQLKDSAGWISVGANSTVTGCTLQNIGVGATGVMYGIYIQSGVVSGNVLDTVGGQVVRVIDSATITGNIFRNCGTGSNTHNINCADASPVNVSNNTFIDPVSASNGTLIYFNGPRGVVQGNILQGSIYRGIWPGVNANNYIVTGNVLVGATIKVVDGSGTNRVIANNL